MKYSRDLLHVILVSLIRKIMNNLQLDNELMYHSVVDF